MMEYLKISHYTEIPGWYDFNSLYDFISKDIPEGGKFVEMGVWLGRSICSFVEKIDLLGKHVEIYAVDTWRGGGTKRQQPTVDQHGGSLFEHFMWNVNQLGFWNKIIPIVGESTEVAGLFFKDKSIFSVFLDGSGEYEGILKDMNAWYPKIGSGGILGGHNYWGGIEKAVKEFSSSENLTVTLFKKSAWMMRKA